MKVMINGLIYDSDSHIISIYLSEQGKEYIRDNPEATVYTFSPEGSDSTYIDLLVQNFKQNVEKQK